MSKIKWILDAGHSGIGFGHYLTWGKRSPEVPPGILEGEFNRRVCHLIHKISPSNTLELTPGPINIPLSYWQDKKYFSSRTAYVNELYKRERKQGNEVAVLSIHANAAGNKGWYDRKGMVIFTPKKPTKKEAKLSLSIADGFKQVSHFDSVQIKHKNVSRILSKTKCTSVLIEVDFMTNLLGAKYLASKDGQKEIAQMIVWRITQYENTKAW